MLLLDASIASNDLTRRFTKVKGAIIKGPRHTTILATADPAGCPSATFRFGSTRWFVYLDASIWMQTCETDTELP